MKVPEGYDSELEGIIDRHTQFGMIPCQYVLSFCELEKDMAAIYEKFVSDGDKVLEIGGRTYPAHKHVVNRTAYQTSEDREIYEQYIVEYLPNVPNIEDIRLFNKWQDVDVVFLHLDYVAQTKDVFPDINTKLGLGQKFIVLEYLWDDYSQLSHIDSNGMFSNDARCREWLDRNRSHMHLGYEVSKFSLIRAMNLSYFYPN